MLNAENLTKSFRGPGSRGLETPLRGASFYVGAAEIVALTGKSGAGKSTAARLLVGTLRADSGSAAFDGRALFDGARYSRRAGRGIQMIPQQPYAALDPRQRLGDAVAEPVLVRGFVQSRRDARRRAAELFAEVSLDPELLDRLPAQVSGGQAQRAAIARVLGVEPKLIIADEATSMLDPGAQETVIAVLKKLVAARGISVLLISHDTELVERTAGRVYALSDGTISEIRNNEMEESL
jgi:peptide/nickel transport system ATP-binding protein